MQTPIRVFNVLSYYAPHISGLTEAVRLSAERIATSQEFQVTVLAMRHDKALPKRETLRGVHVERADTLLSLHKGFLSVDFFPRYRALVRNADVVHLHVPMLEAGLLASLTPRGTPIITSWYCDLATSSRFSVLDTLAVRAVQASSQWACDRSQHICVLSEDYAAESRFLQSSRNKLVVVYPPDNAPDDLQPRGSEHVSHSPRVGFLGRFAEEKGLDVLLDSAISVISKRPDVQFVLAGDYEAVAGGTEYVRLRSRIEQLGSHVILAGRLPYDELFNFYRSLDVFVLPSVNAYEAFGMVQVEAMKAGVPVIASNIRGVRVPVRLTGNGVVVPPRNPSALADAILQLLANPPAPSCQISARAWQHFSTRATAENLMKLYRSALARRPRKSAQ